jgi:hypothetical protein
MRSEHGGFDCLSRTGCVAQASALPVLLRICEAGFESLQPRSNLA